MDISGLGSSYADYLTTTTASSTQASSLQDKLSSAAASGTETSDEELMEACKEFESYFLEQIYDTMLESTKIFSDEEEGDGYASKMVDYFKDSAIQALTDQATDQNGIGLAQTLYEQMKLQYSAVKPEDLE